MRSRDSQEFISEWDVFRNRGGRPVTITEEQVRVVWHALRVVELVRSSESYESMWSNPKPNLSKSRLLGRMLIEGKPPTRSKPPYHFGGPAWSQLPGGDPFADCEDGPSPPVHRSEFGTIPWR